MTDCRIVACVGLLLAFVASPAALAEDGAQRLLPIPDFSADFWHRSHLSGNWSRGGPRTLLANKGIQLDVELTQYVQGIVDGGINRTTRYGGHADYLVYLDLMRMQTKRNAKGGT